MKRFILISVAVLLSAQIASADGYPKAFSDAVQSYSHGNFKKAKELFVACQSSDDFDPVNISIWIGRCDTGLQEQMRDAQAAERRRQAKRAQRIQNGYVYISVNAAESGDLFETTKSAMSEVMKLNGRAFCPNLDDALTIVTVYLNTKQEGSNNGFYKASGEGFVRLGSAIDEKEFIGQWSVDGEATSAVNMEDAIRLLRNKLNFKLSYALENLLNNRPQGQDFYIPEQSISVYFAENNNVSTDLSFLREAINGYISQAPGITLSTALDETRNSERDKISQIEATYVKRESRAPIHELEGFNQRLRLLVRKEQNNDFTFIGEISEWGGTSLATVTIHGSDFGIADLSSHSQELAAKLLAVGLSFRAWDIGEYIGKFKLASFDGLHGLLVQKYAYALGTWDSPSRTTSPFKDIGLIRNSMVENGTPRDEADKWRFPTVYELNDIRENRKRLSLDGTYWTCSSRTRGTHIVVDFLTGDVNDVKDKNGKVASWLLIKEF